MTYRDYKRIARSHRYLTDGESRLPTPLIFFAILCLICVIYILSVVLGADYSESSEAKGNVLMLSQCATILTFAWSGIFCISATNSCNTKINNNKIGCLYISDVYMNLPVTMKDCMQYSCIRYYFFTSPLMITFLLFNIFDVFFVKSSNLSAEIGFTTVIIALLFLFTMLTVVLGFRFSKKARNVFSGIFISFIIGYTCVSLWLYETTFVWNIIYKFRFISGLGGICILIAVYPLSYLIGHLKVFNKRQKGVWSDE